MDTDGAVMPAEWRDRGHGFLALALQADKRSLPDTAATLQAWASTCLHRANVRGVWVARVGEELARGLFLSASQTPAGRSGPSDRHPTHRPPLGHTRHAEGPPSLPHEPPVLDRKRAAGNDQ